MRVPSLVLIALIAMIQVAFSAMPSRAEAQEPVWLRLSARTWSDFVVPAPADKNGSSGQTSDTAFVRVVPGDFVLLDFLFEPWDTWGEPDHLLGILATREGEVLLQTPKSPFYVTPRETLVVGREGIRLSTHSFDAGRELDVAAVDRPSPGASDRVPLSRTSSLKKLPFPWPTTVERKRLEVPASYDGPWGDVVLAIAIDAKGRPGTVQVMRSLGPEADTLAVMNVRKWSYRPKRSGGKSVPAGITVRVHLEDPARFHWSGPWPTN